MARKKDRDDDDRPRRVEPVKRDGAYVMMLSVTFVAITIGCILLYLDVSEYGGKSAPTAPPPAVLKLGEAASTTGTGGAGGAVPPAGGGGAVPKTDPMP